MRSMKSPAEERAGGASKYATGLKKEEDKEIKFRTLGGEKSQGPRFTKKRPFSHIVDLVKRRPGIYSHLRKEES